MDAVLDSLLTGLPVLLAHLFAALAMLSLAAWTYMYITPMEEMELIRGGNRAAAISCAGGLLGIAVPLAACLAASVNLWDLVVWGVVALVLQLIVVRLADMVLVGLRRRIEDGQEASAIMLAAVKLAVAALTAAAIGG